MARRKTEVFSMSFLDCITCAFGSVVLVYVLISAQGGLRKSTESQAKRAEVSQLEEKVLEGYQHLVQLRNSMIMTDDEKVKTEGLGTRVMTETERLKVELADSDKETLSRREAIERLKADLRSLEQGARRLEGATTDPSATGTRVRGFVGTGDRQYLTGLKVGGEHILVLVDVSASMLDETVVNILRIRNMSETRKLMSDKWRRTVSDRRLDRGAAAAGIAISAVRVQHQGLGAAAEQRRQVAEGRGPERAQRGAAGVAQDRADRAAPAWRTRSSR